MRTPDSWRSARVTLAIAAVTALAWLATMLLGLDQWAALWGGFIPLRLSGAGEGQALAPLVLTPLTATLVHGGIIHLAFNLLILLFCGRAVENILGGWSVIILYILGAYAAAAAQYLPDPSSATPMIGASGAISAILGTYAMLFGRNRVKVANPALALWLNALWLAAGWIVLQFLLGFSFGNAGMPLAIAAHIGGFLVGLLSAKPLLLFRYRKA